MLARRHKTWRRTSMTKYQNPTCTKGETKLGLARIHCRSTRLEVHPWMPAVPTSWTLVFSFTSQPWSLSLPSSNGPILLYSCTVSVLYNKSKYIIKIVLVQSRESTRNICRAHTRIEHLRRTTPQYERWLAHRWCCSLPPIAWQPTAQRCPLYLIRDPRLIYTLRVNTPRSFHRHTH